jgi:pectinesterase
MLSSLVFAVLLCIVSSAAAGERAGIIVAKAGSGDFTTIQAAIDAIPKSNDALKIILIKNGVYVEKLMIKTNFIALVGEDRDSTRIQFYQPYSFDSTYADGRAVINIFASDICRRVGSRSIFTIEHGLLLARR